jgi:hypothetical protein
MKNRLISTASSLAILAMWGGVSTTPTLAQSDGGAYTSSADAKRRAPYQEFQTVNCPQNDACLVVFPAVPEGKRLMLQRVNAAILFANGGIRRSALFAAGKPYFVPVQAQQPDFAIVNEAVLTFYEAGQSPSFAVAFNDPNDVTVLEATVTGFLVDVEP